MRWRWPIMELPLSAHQGYEIMIIGNKELDRICREIASRWNEGALICRLSMSSKPRASEDLSTVIFPNTDQRPLTIFGLPVVVDMTLPPGEVRLIDEQGTILGAITNIGEG